MCGRDTQLTLSHTHTSHTSLTHTHTHPHTTHLHTQVSSSLWFYPNSPQRLFVDPSLPSTAVINLELSRLIDPESGISEVAISIGASPNDQSVLNQTTLTLGTNLTSIQSPLFSIAQGVDELHIDIYITNLAGVEIVIPLAPLRCTPVPPTFEGVVLVQPNARSANYSSQGFDTAPPAVCLHDTDVASVTIEQHWESGCDRYAYKLAHSYDCMYLCTLEHIRSLYLTACSSSLLYYLHA